MEIKISAKLFGGGGPQIIPTNFNKLEEKIDKKLNEATQSDPKWCIVSRGLNLKGICDCGGYQHQSWISKGYGYFNIVDQLYENKCSECGKDINKNNIQNLGFFHAKYRFKGRNSKGKKITTEGVAEEFQTFVDGDNDDFYSMNLEVVRLSENFTSL